MLLTLERIKSNSDATLSVLYIDGKFECFCLEDEYRENKVPEETRVPAGTYQIELRQEGGFHQRYKERFSWHRGMLQLMDVPGFEYILIHIGNTDGDTAGCLLVGQGCTAGDDLMVTNSTLAYRAMYEKVFHEAQHGNLEIKILDLDDPQ